MSARETSKASKPPPLELLFSDALTYLQLQTYPAAPELILTGNREAAVTDNGLDFSHLWKFFEDTSDCKCVGERLGKDAWVLEYGLSHAQQEQGVKEGSLTGLSEEDTAVADESIEDIDSDDSTKVERTLPPQQMVAPATSLENTRLVPSAVKRRALQSSILAPANSLESISLLPSIVTRKSSSVLPKFSTSVGASPFSHQDLPDQPLPKDIAHPQAGNTAPPLLVPTNRNVYITTKFNTVTPPSIPSHRTIYPLTYETQLQKKQQIAEKLHHILARGNVDSDICPILEFVAVPPYRFTRSISHQGGLHIFVDISNIVLGFTNCLKLTRGMSPGTHVSQPPFNFMDFAFILERCRPTARRVIVGSCAKDVKMPYHIEANSSGYEVNLLERVSKAPLPKGQRVKSDSGYASASDGPMTGVARSNVEQGVDEILQMKMLESLVDIETPSTIVLATGDAAVAEFSGGFLVNVKRALLKGWKVEIVGWKHNMSQAFFKLARKMDKQVSLRGKLRIILLDDMAEDLLAWYRPG